MLPPQNQNPDTSISLNVGECPHCQTLFAIPAEGKEVSLLCPACEAELSAIAMRPRTLPVARLAPVAPTPASPELETPVELPTSPLGLSGGAVLGGLIPEQAETVSVTEKEKRSLSETLGWTPGELAPQVALTETSEAIHSEPLPDTTSLGNATLPDTKAPTLKDFQFDFGNEPAASETPLEEEFLESVPPTVGKDLTNAETLEYGTEEFVSRLANTVEPVVEETSSGVDWSPSEDFQTTTMQNKSRQKKSWAGPLSAVAGLLVVGLPAGYFALTGFDSESLLNSDIAAENRASRAASTNNEIPPLPYAMQTEPNKGVVAAVATLPSKKAKGATTASFDSVPSPPMSKSSESNDRYAKDRQVSDRNSQDRYGQDRYADRSNRSESGEPNPFAAADAMAMETPVAEPVAEPDTEPAKKPALLRAGTPQLTTDTRNSRLMGAPAYGFETLVQAVSEATPSAKAFAEGSLANEEEVPAMGQHYARLCYLAQVLTLMDPAASHPDLMTQEFEGVDLYKRLFRDAGAREDSRQIVGPWMTWSGRPHGGVFFAGIPDQTGRVGEVYEYRFPVADGDIFVVTEEPIDAKRFLNSKANEVGVIGIVVEDPRARIKGYEGSADRVIWTRKTAPLPPTGN